MQSRSRFDLLDTAHIFSLPLFSSFRPSPLPLAVLGTELHPPPFYFEFRVLLHCCAAQAGRHCCCSPWECWVTGVHRHTRFTHIFLPFVSWWHWSWSRFWLPYAVPLRTLCKCPHTPCFRFFCVHSKPSGGTDGLYSKSVFNFWKSQCSVFHSCTIWHAYGQCLRVLSFPLPCQQSFLYVYMKSLY